METDFQPCELCHRDTEDWQEFRLTRQIQEIVYICALCRQQIREQDDQTRQAFWQKYCLEPARPYGSPAPRRIKNPPATGEDNPEDPSESPKKARSCKV